MKILLIFALLTVIGCTTAYGPYSITGGYKERQLNENTYVVSFFGNGTTSEQQVWNYWFYRCAELTSQKGYKYFDLIPSDTHAFFRPSISEPEYQFTMLDAESNTGAVGEKVQYYVTQVTTYSSKAQVHMYNDPVPEEVKSPLYAETVIEMLSPYVQSKAKVTPPDRKILLLRAGVEALIKSKRVDELEAKKMEETQI